MDFKDQQDIQAENGQLRARVRELEEALGGTSTPAESLDPGESHFRTLVNTSPFGIQLSDTTGKIFYSNAAHHRIHGYPDGELIGRFIWDLVADPKVREELKTYYAMIIAEQPDPQPYFSEDQTRDGNTIHTRIDWDYFRNAQGVVEGTFSIISDITEKARSEQAFQESESRFQEMVNSITSGVGVYEVLKDGQFGVDYIIKDFNRSALELEGLTREEVIGKTLKEIRPNIDDVGLLPHFREVWKTGEPAFVPVLFYVDDRFRNYYENRIYRLSSGEIVAIFDDVTERETAIANLRESEQRFEQAMEATRDGLYDWDLQKNTIYYSPGWKRMLGYAPDELPDDFSVWERLTDPEDVKRSWVMQNELLNRERDRFELEFKMKHKDGHWVDILSRASAIFDEDDNAVRIVGTHLDITERKNAELEKENLQAQLLQAQKMESIGRLAGGVAHDFNNKLSVILGFSEMALEQVADDHPLVENLQQIHKAALRSGEITRQLLAFARKQTIAPGVMGLNVAITAMHQMLQRLIGEEISLRWLPGENLWNVMMDNAQIDQVLANLVVNARDAISGSGNIIIETRNITLDKESFSNSPDLISGDHVMLAVTDDGCGMDAETRQNLFEPFFTTKDLHEGTGLGMSTVYGIMMQNQGLITVKSTPDAGSTIRLFLPRCEGSTLTIVHDGQKELPAAQGETILLVEDERAICEMTTTILEKLGYTVLAANTPTRALELAEGHEHPIHLLFTDVVLPVMDGRQLSEKLKTRFPELKVLYMSGYTADVIANRGVLDGDVQFIQKPFSTRTVAEKVREVLDT